MRADRGPGRARMLGPRPRRAPVAAWIVLALACAAAVPARAQRFDGFNVVAAPDHPHGSASARTALAAMRRAGAQAAAIVLFLWQRDPAHTGIVRGGDMPDAALRLAIREARGLGLRVMVKPHVWVDGNWAGSIEPPSPKAWRAWFEGYRAALLAIARLAAEEGAEALSIGTELRRTTHRPEWLEIIAAVRAVFPGLLTYAAHNLSGAEAVPFWSKLDAVGVTLYPALGADGDRAGRRAVMRATAERLDALARREGKPVIVAEIGIRSAVGAARKPWESAEERQAPPDRQLQAEVLGDWLDALDRPAIDGVLVWRWFTDPSAGGPADTDFTVQGKPAERVFVCARTKDCPN
jgi:hypothetical protein